MAQKRFWAIFLFSPGYTGQASAISCFTWQDLQARDARPAAIVLLPAFANSAKAHISHPYRVFIL